VFVNSFRLNDVMLQDYLVLIAQLEHQQHLVSLQCILTMSRMSLILLLFFSMF